MKRLIEQFGEDRSGAVAPLIAISLFGLVAVGGIAFDYARMASMDTELQNAADQAALAAVSQLDGQADACSRATAAARNLIANRTLLANDGAAIGITIPNEPDCDDEGQIRFYQDIGKATAATDYTNAKFVEVQVDSRRANFALTPIVAALSSGQVSATAFAGLGEAICNTPPLMMCNPDEPQSPPYNVNADFDADAYKGVGIRLVGDGSYEAGNFGFLESGFGSGANDLLKALGYNTPPGECLPTTGVTTKTGLNANVFDGLNTRFDIDANGNSCPDGDENCSPSVNVRKGLVRGNQCGITGNGWAENASDSSNFDTRNYRPTSAAVYDATKTPDIMGHPRDLCHAWDDEGNCGGVAGRRMGTGDWDINAYWRSNYGSNYSGQVSASTYGSQPKGYPTRYQVYRWEIDDYANRLNPKSAQGSTSAYSRPVASTCLATPDAPHGLVPGELTVDRRRISMAVLNCKALGIGGHETNQPVVKWVDLFLVEPSIERNKCTQNPGCKGGALKYSDKTDLYVEIIGETENVGTGNFQVVKKAVPYLIE